MIAASAPRGVARRALLRGAPALGLVLLAAGCGRSSRAERFIQGTWFYAGTVPGTPQHRPVSWHVEWTFNSGYFRQSGYPPLLSEGRYRVVRSAENAITLTLFEQKGNFSEADRTIEIAIDHAAGTISVNNSPALLRKTGP
jgi:hypothetical protein